MPEPADGVQKPPVASAAALARKQPNELEGQVLSEKQIADIRSDANNYATTKSVTQVNFTTSAIASNVTLWNQLNHNSSRFGALSALIWLSVALNVFVILLATYLSFQRPKKQPEEDAAAAKVGTHANAMASPAAGPAQPGGVGQPVPEHKAAALVAPVFDKHTVKDLEAGTGDSVHPDLHGLPHHKPKMTEHATDPNPKKKDVGGCCCWAGSTHREYSGDTIELCGIRLYSRTNAHPSWACCDVGCCALFRVAGTGKGLGMLSVKPSKKQQRHFMDAKNNLLNEVIGILAVTIVIMNVIISALAAGTK